MTPPSAQQLVIRKRSRARRLAMQALYQWQVNPDTGSELKRQYIEKREYKDADPDYFNELLTHALKDADDNQACIAEHADRALDQLDPLEVSIMMVALTEMRHRMDVPFRVVINEAVELAQRFGATDGHKYVNAILDRAASELRALEKR